VTKDQGHASLSYFVEQGKKIVGDVANLIGKTISLIHLKPSPSTLGCDHNQRS
jgi:hypothetical protein